MYQWHWVRIRSDPALARGAGLMPLFNWVSIVLHWHSHVSLFSVLLFTPLHFGRQCISIITLTLSLFLSPSACHCRQTMTAMPSAAKPTVIIIYLLVSQTALLSLRATINHDSNLSETPGWMSRRWRKANVVVKCGAMPQAHSWPCNLWQQEEMADRMTSGNVRFVVTQS